MHGSEPGKFSWWDLATTLLISSLPVIIVGLEHLQQALTGVDLGWGGPLILSAIAAVIIGLKKYATDTRKP